MRARDTLGLCPPTRMPWCSGWRSSLSHQGLCFRVKATDTPSLQSPTAVRSNPLGFRFENEGQGHVGFMPTHQDALVLRVAFQSKPSGLVF